MQITLSNLIPLAATAALLAACSSQPTVRVTNDKPAAPQVASRSEPIFYNGKTYKLDFSPRANGGYDMAISGMGPKQKKDAINVATSSLSYFACPDGHRGKLQNEPAYVEAKWRMQAKCG